MHRRLLLAQAVMAGVITRAGVASAQPSVGPSNLVERFAATLTAHDMEGFAALFGEDYVNHQVSAAAPPPAAGLSPKQGSVNFFKARLVGIPDLKVSIETMVAADDSVAASFVYTGTHGGPLFGVAPTGRALRFTSCDIFRVADGRLAEHWGMGDIAGVLAQLKG